MRYQVEYLMFSVREKTSKYLGQSGAEMVEYAVVLACIAALGVVYYKADKTSTGGTGTATLNGILTDLWNLISSKADAIMGK